MLDQEGPKCEERQLNLMASLLAGRHRLPLSSSEHGLRREQRVSPSAGPAFGKLHVFQGLRLDIKVCIGLLAWEGGEYPST